MQKAGRFGNLLTALTILSKMVLQKVVFIRLMRFKNPNALIRCKIREIISDYAWFGCFLEKTCEFNEFVVFLQPQ